VRALHDQTRRAEKLSWVGTTFEPVSHLAHQGTLRPSIRERIVSWQGLHLTSLREIDDPMRLLLGLLIACLLACGPAPGAT
jgi:hypothetical protein